MKDDEPAFLGFACQGNLDEEAAYTICRMIETVAWQIRADWDWDSLTPGKRNYGSLINISLLKVAWRLLAQKGQLNLQTTNDDIKRISTIAPLVGLRGLRSLVLQNNLVVDLQPLSGMSRLKHLNCYRNRVADIGPLGHLRHLEKVELGQNPLTSMSVLEQLPDLRDLSISTDQVGGLIQCKRLRCA